MNSHLNNQQPKKATDMTNTQQTLEIGSSSLINILFDYFDLSPEFTKCVKIIHSNLKNTLSLTDDEIETGFFKYNYERIYIALECLKELKGFHDQIRHAIAQKIETNFNRSPHFISVLHRLNNMKLKDLTITQKMKRNGLSLTLDQIYKASFNSKITENILSKLDFSLTELEKSIGDQS